MPTPAIPPEPNVIENRRWRLVFDPKAGNAVSLTDRVHDCEVLGAPGGRAVVMADPSDTWGHDVLRFQQEVATFTPGRVERLEHGPGNQCCASRAITAIRG